MAERTEIAKISFISDTETASFKVGEVSGSFDEKKLDRYLKIYGHEKLCAALGFMQFQVWERLRRLNRMEDIRGNNNVGVNDWHNRPVDNPNPYVREDEEIDDYSQEG